MRRMTSFNFRIHSLNARKTVPDATRLPLVDQGGGSQRDMKALLRSL